MVKANLENSSRSKELSGFFLGGKGDVILEGPQYLSSK